MLDVQWIVGGGFALGGLLFGGIGLGMKRHIHKKSDRCSVMTVAKVVGIASRNTDSGFEGGGGTLYSPVIEYSAHGQPVQAVSAYGTSKSRYTVGQEVTVHYNPQRADDFFIDGDKTPVILSTVFVAVGAALLLIAATVPLIANALRQ